MGRTRTKREIRRQNIRMKLAPNVINENFYARKGTAKPEGLIFPPEIAQLIREERIKEAIREEQEPGPPETKVIQVVNIRTGTTHWMVPEQPQPIYYEEPIERTIVLKKLFRSAFLFSTIALMILTFTQLFFWLLLLYSWPIDFVQDLLSRRAYIYGKYVKEIVFFLAVHPFVQGILGVACIICCRDKCMKTYFLRTTLFCPVSFVMILAAIYCISTITYTDILPSFREGIDLYGLTNSTKLDPQRIEKAKFYYRAWDALQLHLQCCGIHEMDDWILQREEEIIKVPKTCCRSYRHTIETKLTARPKEYDEDIEHCIKYPSAIVVWDEGCIAKFFEFVTNITSGFLICQLMDIILVAMSCVFGMLYHTCRVQELDSDYYYPIQQFVIDTCFCNSCIKLNKEVTDEELKELKEEHHWTDIPAATEREDEAEFHVQHKHDHEHPHHHTERESIMVIPIEDVMQRRATRMSRTTRKSTASALAPKGSVATLARRSIQNEHP